jgi:hypothetical protein
MTDIFERDQQNSDYALMNEGSTLNLDYYLNTLYTRGQSDFQLINVDSAFKAFVLIFVDGEQVARILVGEGVQHIPFALHSTEFISVYIRPHDSVGNVGTVNDVYIELV